MDPIIEKVKALITVEKGSVLYVTAAIGSLWVISVVLNLLRAFYAHFLRPAKHLRKYGEWAVVTGATDGIGKALAVELARKGLSILLISRTESKLVEVETELTTKFPKISVAHVAVDFSDFNTQAQEAVKAAVSGKSIGILVNNVGASYSHPKFFYELSEDEITQLLALNVVSTTAMIKIILPQMVDRKRGAIINMASGAAVAPTALLSGYSGVKGYILKMSESLHVELAPKGIHVQCQVPLLVATKLSKIRRPSWDKPTPGAYARAAITFIGRDMTCSPYWAHALELWGMRTLPLYIVNKITYGMHMGLRKKAMNKAAKEGKKTS